MGRRVLLVDVAGLLRGEVESSGGQAVHLEVAFAIRKCGPLQQTIDADQCPADGFSGDRVHYRSAHHEGLAASGR